jgi:hypothetical protein
VRICADRAQQRKEVGDVFAGAALHDLLYTATERTDPCGRDQRIRWRNDRFVAPHRKCGDAFALGQNGASSSRNHSRICAGCIEVRGRRGHGQSAQSRSGCAVCMRQRMSGAGGNCPFSTSGQAGGAS